MCADREVNTSQPGSDVVETAGENASSESTESNSEVTGSKNLRKYVDKETTGLKSIAPIFAVQFMFMLALALSASNFPFIWTTLPWSRGSEVRGATLSTFGVFANAFAEFLSAAFLGVLSDRYGRKPFLILSCLGQIIDFTTAGMATEGAVHGVPKIAAAARPALCMLSARLLAGFCGNLTIFTKAYLGDVSTAKTSSRNFALLFVSVGGSFLLGMPLGGFLSRRSMRLPMMVAALLNLVNMLLIIFTVKESLRPENRTQVVWRKANPVGALQFLLSTRFLLLFGVMTFLDQFALSLLHHVFFQYCKIVFDVPKRSSIILIMVFAVVSIFSVVLIQSPRVLKRYGEISILRVGYVLTCVAFACLALVSYTKLFMLLFPCMLILAMGAVSGPVQNAIATRCVGDNEQGILQAANGSLDVVGKMVSAGMVSVLFQPIMSINQPAIIWWIASVLAMAGVWAAFNLHRYLPATFQAFPSSKDVAGEP